MEVFDCTHETLQIFNLRKTSENRLTGGSRTKKSNKHTGTAFFVCEFNYRVRIHGKMVKMRKIQRKLTHTNTLCIHFNPWPYVRLVVHILIEKG